jgi:type II secretory pathway pseudopilin PulG
MKIKKMKNKLIGLTLIEAIIALNIIAVMIVFILLFLTSISAYMNKGQNILLATNIAQKQIEFLKTYTNSELKSLSQDQTTRNEPIKNTVKQVYYDKMNNVEVEDSERVYTVYTSISQQHDHAYYDIEVKVEWNENKKNEDLHSTRLETYITGQPD